MKQHFFLAVIALLLCATALHASNTSVGGIWYNFDNDNLTATVTYHGATYSAYSNEYSSSVEIPESVTYSGATYTVTSIDLNAFNGCTNLTSVSIPKTINAINSCAFRGCNNLLAVYITDVAAWCGISFGMPDANPLSMAKALYLNGELVTDLVIPEGVTRIGYAAFYKFEPLTSVTIPESLTSVGYYAFENCKNLTSVHISSIASWCAIDFEGVGLQNNPLEYAHNLYLNDELVTDLVIPEGVTYINAGAFYQCSCLTSVTIPESVSRIGSSVFRGCDNLPVIDNIRYADSYLIEALGSFQSRYTIRPGTKWIGDYAFSYQYIDSIDIPEGVIQIGDAAFEHCYRLTYISIPNSVTSIGLWAFKGCSQLTSINIPNTVTNIGDDAFLNVGNINYKGNATGTPWGALYVNNSPIIYPLADIQNIASKLASDQTSDEYFHFAGVVSEISEISTSYGNATFYISDGTTTFYCYRLYDYFSTRFTSTSQLSIGDSVVICSKLQNYKGNTPEAVEGYLFYHSANPVFTPDSVLYYGFRSENSAELKLYEAIDKDTLDIPESVTYNGTEYTVTEIAPRAIYNKSNVRYVSFPSTLKVFPSAFNKCSIQKVWWNVRNMGDYDITPPYTDRITVTLKADNLTWDNVYLYAWDTDNNPIRGAWPGTALEKDADGNYTYTFSANYSSKNPVNMIWTNGTDQTIDIKRVGLSTVYTLHSLSGNSITYSENTHNVSPFADNTTITEFIFGNSVERIPAHLCEGLSQLTNINITDGVQEIGASAFAHCQAVTDIVLPASVQTIGNSAFSNCSSLTTLILGENITSYGNNAFTDCAKLTTIHNYRERPAKLGTNTFSGVDYFNCTLYVLAGSVDMYKSTGSDWKDFYFVEPISGKSVLTDQLVVTPAEYAANVAWPTVENAATYELVVKDKQGEVVCTLVFDAEGRLTQIAFAAPARAPQQTEAAGFSFTVIGLESASKYALSIAAKDANGATLETFDKVFYTTGYDMSSETYTVIFLDWDGTELDRQTVAYGTDATAPADPEREGWRFMGWNVTFTNVTGDLTVTAQYEEINDGLNDAEADRLTAPQKVLDHSRIFILLPDGRRYDITGRCFNL